MIVHFILFIFYLFIVCRTHANVFYIICIIIVVVVVGVTPGSRRLLNS